MNFLSGSRSVAVRKGHLCLLVGSEHGDLQRVLRALFNKGNKTLEGPVTLVVEEVTGTCRLEFDGGETRDAEGEGSWEIVLGGLHLGTVRKAGE